MFLFVFLTLGCRCYEGREYVCLGLCTFLQCTVSGTYESAMTRMDREWCLLACGTSRKPAKAPWNIMRASMSMFSGYFNWQNGCIHLAFTGILCPRILCVKTWIDPDSQHLLYVHVFLLHLVLTIMSEIFHHVHLCVLTLPQHPALDLAHTRGSINVCWLGVDFILMARRYFDQDFTLGNSIYDYSGIWGMGHCDHIMKVKFVGLGKLTITKMQMVSTPGLHWRTKQVNLCLEANNETLRSLKTTHSHIPHNAGAGP